MWNQFFNGSQTNKTVEASAESFYRDSSESFRQTLLPDSLKTPKTLPRLLLVDDDPTFGKIMNRAAEMKGVKITYCKSIDELGALQSWDFDAIIMDYDLGAVTGFELTEYLEKFTKEDVPVILVSQTKQKSSKHWPNTIREFVHKNLGPFAILDATFEAHEIREIHRTIKHPVIRH
jgi:CheY-like chemotaxis protein